MATLSCCTEARDEEAWPCATALSSVVAVFCSDVLYDHKIKLIVSAEVLAPDLYTEGQITGEFSRTVSRLIEMQSRDYLDAPRRVVDTSLT